MESILLTITISLNCILNFLVIHGNSNPATVLGIPVISPATANIPMTAASGLGMEAPIVGLNT
jgi:hypothetical protein